MKKMASLFTLLVFLGTSFLTPVSYAQITEMGISNVSINEELQNEELTDEIETFNTVGENPEDPTQFTLETSDDPSSLQMENRDLDVALQDLPQRSGTMFISGRDFNLRLKNLANDNEYYSTWDHDENIIKFKKSNTPAPDGFATTGLATDDSEYEIITWYDNGTIYYYTEADDIYLNPDSRNMFKNMINIISVDTSKRNTSKVESMNQMFAGCESLEELDISNWDTRNVTDMASMFAGCESLEELDVSNWNTSNVTNMSNMFYGCAALISLDVSSFDTSNVTNMYSMFRNCFNLKELDVSGRDTSSVISMEQMFYNCLALTELDVSRWDTSNVQYMNEMFDFCINLNELDLNNWNTNNVKNMNGMFYQCDSLETIYVSDKFVTTSLYDGYDMFQNNYSLVGGNGTKFNTDYTDADYANIDTTQTPGYFTNISGNTVIVKFFMNNGSDIDIQVIEKGNTIGSVEPSKDNAVFKGWYADERLTRSFSTSTAVNSNLKLYAKWECEPGYYNNKGICVDESKKIEHKGGVIKLTDGENTVYIKDRNQGATQAKRQGVAYKFIMPILEKIGELNGDLLNIPYGWLYRYVIQNLSEIEGENMVTMGDFIDYYDTNWVNVFKAIKSKNDEGNYTDSYGDYYYRGNNGGISYKDIGFKDMEGYAEIGYFLNEILGGLLQGLNEYSSTLFIDIPESKIEGGFNGGKIGEENTGWEKGNTDNPCDASKGEYLPTIDDWVKLMQVRGNINGYEVVKSELELGEDSYAEAYVFGSGLDTMINGTLNSPMNPLDLLNLEITDDLMIPGAGGIVKLDSDLVRMMGSLPEEEIDNAIDAIIDHFGTEYIRIPLLSPLRVASESGDTVGIYIGEAGIISVTNDIGTLANDIAAPVRCFVDESAWPDEEKEENNYSGGGGRGGSSSKSDIEVDNHGAADEEKDVDNDNKIEENQENAQIENNTEAPVSQNDQGNKGNNPISDEFQQAYNFAHSYGITTKNSAENAQMNSHLTRIQMAKMLSQYAMNVLGKEPDISKGVVTFKDVTNKMNKDYDNGVILAYQLGIMGQNMKDDKFRPNDEVTRAEFVTALSRLLYSTSDGEYKSTGKYYINHMEKLKKEGIITKDDPNMKEKRGYVMIMLMRTVK